MFLLLSLLSFNQSVEGSSMPSPSNSTRPSISIKITGLPVSVWSAAETMNQCNNGQIDVPDIPARAFLASKNNSENEIVRIVVGAEGYHEMHGPSIFNQTRSCDFSWNATFDPDPSMFSANEFLDSTFRFDNGTVVALVHTGMYEKFCRSVSEKHFIYGCTVPDSSFPIFHSQRQSSLATSIMLVILFKIFLMRFEQRKQAVTPIDSCEEGLLCVPINHL